MVATASHIDWVYQKKVEIWLNLLSNSETRSFCGRMRKIFWSPLSIFYWQSSLNNGKSFFIKSFERQIEEFPFSYAISFHDPTDFVHVNVEEIQSITFPPSRNFRTSPSSSATLCCIHPDANKQAQWETHRAEKSYQRWSIEIRFHPKSHFNLHKFWLRSEKKLVESESEVFNFRDG